MAAGNSFPITFADLGLIFVGMVIHMIVGSFWYHLSVFGKIWMDALGVRKNQLGQPGPAMTIALLCSAFQTLGILITFHHIPVSSVCQAAVVGSPKR
jgi:hypothetical protein